MAIAGDSGGSQPDNRVPALKVRQWLPEWDDIAFDEAQRQGRPRPHFFLFSMPASKLRSLAGIYRRSTDDVQPRGEDLGIQRRHDPERSAEIKRYVVGGYPWSTLTDAKRGKPDSDDLRKPGWLPTAVVVNILEPGAIRQGKTLDAANAISVPDGLKLVTIELPEEVNPELPPLEVIDGQHRLFAFDEDDRAGQDYELPVVAFVGLDISWQAYLFWTINIKPKKINPSLAFDLYPLLREQTWLESGEAVHVYRESRAQELTEALWASPSSPWHRRINMLGGSRKSSGPVTQAAFIRSLMASMVKPWSSRVGAGGIFGGSPDGRDGLEWSRLQQATFLVTAWRLLAEAVKRSNAPWAVSLRENAGELDGLGAVSSVDAAFAATTSLLATDQGVRGYQHVVNDLCFAYAHQLDLSAWTDPTSFAEITAEHIELAAEGLRQQKVHAFLSEIAESLARFDWRTSNAAGLDEVQRLEKGVFRGSSGYKELRTKLFAHLAESPSQEVRTAVDLARL